MSHRLLPLVLALAAASLVACTDLAPRSSPSAAPSTEPIAREWECVSVCFPERPCQNICRLSPFEPGFAVVPPPSTCDSRRPINVCGDGCCDAAEADLRGDPGNFCFADCVRERLEISDRIRPGSLQIVDGDRVAGTVDPGFVSFEPSCK